MGAKAAYIFNRERNQDMRASVKGIDELVGGPIGIEFTVLRLLSIIALDSRHLWESSVLVDSDNHRIDNQVHAISK
jgi:hypothetical protein